MIVLALPEIDSKKPYAAVAGVCNKNPFKISVIHMNLNYRAEFSPSPAGRSPQRGRVGVGVSDIAHELKLLFFNDFAALTPTLSHRERGAYRLFSRFSVPYTSTRKNAIPQDFEQVLRHGYGVFWVRAVTGFALTAPTGFISIWG